MRNIFNILIKPHSSEERATALLRKSLFANDLAAVKSAIKSGARLNDIIEAPRDRPLHLAVDYASDDIVLTLINAGAKVQVAVHAYPCKTFLLSDYAEIAGRAALAQRIRQLEFAAQRDDLGTARRP